ncbi:hypothetical protein B0H11DRAFT_2330244 [Mycena galericulata]|nr:hypothetical protein B0H11DRAFT_2330244 [Mycena galericulata]
MYGPRFTRPYTASLLTRRTIVDPLSRQVTDWAGYSRVYARSSILQTLGTLASKAIEFTRLCNTFPFHDLGREIELYSDAIKVLDPSLIRRRVCNIFCIRIYSLETIDYIVAHELTLNILSGRQDSLGFNNFGTNFGRAIELNSNYVGRLGCRLALPASEFRRASVGTARIYVSVGSWLGGAEVWALGTTYTRYGMRRGVKRFSGPRIVSYTTRISKGILSFLISTADVPIPVIQCRRPPWCHPGLLNSGIPPPRTRSSLLFHPAGNLANDRAGTAILATVAHLISQALDMKLSTVHKLALKDGQTRSVHRCAGYVREEITLATTMVDSAMMRRVRWRSALCAAKSYASMSSFGVSVAPWILARGEQSNARLHGISYGATGSVSLSAIPTNRRQPSPSTLPKMSFISDADHVLGEEMYNNTRGNPNIAFTRYRGTKRHREETEGGFS